jgi:hypothetical protein
MKTLDEYRRRPGAQAILSTVLIPLNLIPGKGQIPGLLQSCPGQTKPFTVAAQDEAIVDATVHLEHMESEERDILRNSHECLLYFSGVHLVAHNDANHRFCSLVYSSITGNSP